ncbi:hypothetical protein [Methanobrevibacter arboriphilus]|uniref:hypothetical protein n=1 Tax=Methanobrevibacter arboriphilus TaxID=39441 RepID=UPI000AB6E857|nr:hypothetical protein [Methanobrevibacter arboriphilus]
MEINWGIIELIDLKKVIEGKKIENLDNLDFVNRDIVSHSKSPNPLLLKEPHFSILTSRACYIIVNSVHQHPKKCLVKK